jgi:hypothetical protein
MILLFHITFATTSMVVTGLAYVRPSHQKLRTSYGLVAATLVSGTYLVISTHGPLLESCITGLVYLGIVFGGIIATQRKLAAQKQSDR